MNNPSASPTGRKARATQYSWWLSVSEAPVHQWHIATHEFTLEIRKIKKNLAVIANKPSVTSENDKEMDKNRRHILCCYGRYSVEEQKVTLCSRICCLKRFCCKTQERRSEYRKSWSFLYNRTL